MVFINAFRKYGFLDVFTPHTSPLSEKTQIRNELVSSPEQLEILFELYFWDFQILKMDIPIWLWNLCESAQHRCRNFCVWHMTFNNQ